MAEMALAAGQYTLTLDQLGQLDREAVGACWKRQLAQVLADLQNRPTVSNARKITLELLCEPKTFERGGVTELSGLSVKARISNSIPKHETNDVDVSIIGRAGRETLVFANQQEAEE